MAEAVVGTQTGWAGTRLARPWLRQLPFRLARFLARKGRPDLGLKTLSYAAKHIEPAYDLLALRCHLARLLGNPEQERAAAEALLFYLDPAIQDGNLRRVLNIMIAFEGIEMRLPLQAGEFLARVMGSQQRRKRLLKLCLERPESLFATQIAALVQALEGDYRAASARISGLMQDLPSTEDSPALKGRITALRDTWNTVDRIANDNVDWADGDQSAEAGAAFERVQESGQDDALSRSKLLREQLLQTREHEKFLQFCKDDFDKATTVAARLNAIRHMLRVGLRRVPDYTGAHVQARACLDTMDDEITALLRAPLAEQLKPRHVALLNTLFDLAIALRRDKLVDRILSHFNAIAGNTATDQSLWTAAATLAAHARGRFVARKIMESTAKLPIRTEAHIRDYLRWANLEGAYAEAKAFSNRVPASLRRSPAMMQFAETLQRLGQISSAHSLVKKIYAEYLTRPWAVRTSQLNKFNIRSGELKFLDRAAEIMGQVEQPRQPQGVIFILARNIAQLRNYPLVVLRRFKSRGWAVIPLVEGLMPRERTGIPELDLLNGAITKQATLNTMADETLPLLNDFNVSLDEGKLTWGKIDLSHAMWEDAAINRRRYNIHWTCPELQERLGKLVDWAQSTGRVLDYASALSKKRKLRMGFISLFGHRLPDCVPRFYCAAKGNPDRFFSIHAANGYQNYFTNFSTNISERFVLRNMTRHRDVRSASFPIPENFNRYYEANRHRTAELLEQYEDVTKVRRSTGDQKVRPLEADEAAARIAEWRAKGGKVACAFGKVACDSSVPFDGGPTHANMQDWINHCVRTVKDSNTLLLIKPHPHELNNQIATFPTQFFSDLIQEEMGPNVMFLGHRWFDMHDIAGMIDLGVVYNGTTAIELGIMGIPCILAGHFAPIDYPIGHVAPQSREDFEAYLRFERPAQVAADIRERAAVWLHYMSNQEFTLPYRFHTRQVTNKKLYPPYWFEEDIHSWRRGGNMSPDRLINRVLGLEAEPGGQVPSKRAPKKPDPVPGAA